MIHLDTNLLIAAIDSVHPHHALAVRALRSGQPVAADSVAWTEFCSKPVPAARIQALRILLNARILPYAEAEAELAGRLFQLPGTTRAQRLDTMIAASAILAGAALATASAADYAPFVPHGLKLF